MLADDAVCDPPIPGTSGKKYRLTLPLADTRTNRKPAALAGFESYPPLGVDANSVVTPLTACVPKFHRFGVMPFPGPVAATLRARVCPAAVPSNSSAEATAASSL